MTLTYTTSYEVTPWAASLDKNQQTVYVPELLEAFTQGSIFYKLVDYAVDLMAQRTQTIVFTQRLNPPPNIATLDNRALWLPQLYMDSRQIQITTER